MTFKKGQSGNPAGRPRGSTNFAALRKKIKTGEILEAVEKAALEGDMTAARLLLERSLPALRPVDSPITLPAGESLADVGRHILEAVSQGELTPNEGSTLLSGLGQLGQQRRCMTVRLEPVVVDLEGAMVLPGFVDAHGHPFAGGLVMQGVDLQTDDRDEVFQKIRDYVASTDDEVVLGYGVRFNPWTDGNPTAAMLDEIDSERPLSFFTIDAHGAWANGHAVSLAPRSMEQEPQQLAGSSRRGAAPTKSSG